MNVINPALRCRIFYVERKKRRTGTVDENAIFVGNITGNFIGNYIKSRASNVSGGVIYNGRYASIKSITGNFINNYLDVISGHGIAISNNQDIGYIKGDFIGNSSYSDAASSSSFS